MMWMPFRLNSIELSQSVSSSPPLAKLDHKLILDHTFVDLIYRNEEKSSMSRGGCVLRRHCGFQRLCLKSFFFFGLAALVSNHYLGHCWRTDPNLRSSLHCLSQWRSTRPNEFRNVFFVKLLLAYRYFCTRPAVLLVDILLGNIYFYPVPGY